jgi:hypothetical protein
MAMIIGSQGLAGDDSIVMVPPGLKEVHYVDPDIEEGKISNVLSRIRKEEERKD